MFRAHNHTLGQRQTVHLVLYCEAAVVEEYTALTSTRHKAEFFISFASVIVLIVK